MGLLTYITDKLDLTRVDSLSPDEQERLRHYLWRIQYYDPSDVMSSSATDGLDPLYYGRPGGDENETCIADAKGLPNAQGSAHYVKMVSRHNYVPLIVDSDSSCLSRDFGTESITIEDDDELTEVVRHTIEDSECYGLWSWPRLFTLGGAYGDIWAHSYRPREYAERYRHGVAVAVETPDVVFPYLEAHSQSLREIRVMYRYRGESADLSRPGARLWSTSWHSYVEHVGPEAITVYLDDQVQADLSGPNDLAAIGELGFAHFAHIDSHGFFGRPAPHGLYSEIDRLNMLCAYFDYAIKIHTTPKLTIYGAGKSETEQFWDPRIALKLPAEARVQFTSWNIDYGFMNYVNAAVEAFQSRVPQFALKDASRAAESAAALRYRLFQLDNHVAKLEQTYARGIKQTVRQIAYLATGAVVPHEAILVNWGERFPADTIAKLEQYKLEREVFGSIEDVVRSQAEAEGWEAESVDAIIAATTKQAAPAGQPVPGADRRTAILEAARKARAAMMAGAQPVAPAQTSETRTTETEVETEDED